MRSSSIVMGHPHLNSNATQAAVALAEAGALREFHTSFDLSFLARHGPTRHVRRAAARRSLPPLIHAVTKTHPVAETARLVRRAAGRNRIGVYEPDATAHAIDRAVARTLRVSDSAVYAYEDSARDSFSRAQDLGLERIYDLPIGYWRAADELLSEEARINPEWAGTIASRLIDNQETRTERKDYELAAASKIVVASSFTRRTLELAPFAIGPVEVVPYGAPEPGPRGERGPRSPGKLRVLFVGSLSQRKGLSYLLDAVRSMSRYVSLTVVGLPVGDKELIQGKLREVSAEWIPSLGHDAVLDLMRTHDVLAFPSLFEGFGLVLSEALSQGLPVIATDHTAAPDLITSGVEGWIVPIRSAEAIRQAFDCALSSESALEDMRHACLDRATRLAWSTYRRHIQRIAR